MRDVNAIRRNWVAVQQLDYTSLHTNILHISHIQARFLASLSIGLLTTVIVVGSGLQSSTIAADILNFISFIFVKSKNEIRS